MATRLASRALLRVSGTDTVRFLQGLVTANVHRLCRNENRTAERALFAAFLNRRGRVEHLAILIASEESCSGAPESIIIDCARDSATALRTHLLHHRLRARVDVDDASDELAVATGGDDHSFFADPRGSALPTRAVLPISDADALRPDDGVADALRILSGVPCERDGSGALPLVLGLDLLGAVDFDKGCYLGQELTARSHFTGVLRRRLAPLLAGDGVIGGHKTAFRRDGDVLREGEQLFYKGGDKAGVVSSACGNAGLAVLKIEDAFASGARVGKSLVTEGGIKVRTWMPEWWGDEVRDSAAS